MRASYDGAIGEMGERHAVAVSNFANAPRDPTMKRINPRSRHGKDAIVGLS
jgi:hypothetical protein